MYDNQLTPEHIRRRIEFNLERARIFETSVVQRFESSTSSDTAVENGVTVRGSLSEKRLAWLKALILGIPVVGKLARWIVRTLMLPHRFYVFQYEVYRQLKQARQVHTGMQEQIVGIYHDLQQQQQQLSILTEVEQLPDVYEIDGVIGPTDLSEGYAKLDNFLAALDNVEGASEDDILYIAIETVLRGSEELIASRQSQYLPSFEIPEENRQFPVLDVGCGRGEFLVKLRDAEIPCIGVDTNPVLAKKLQDEGFEVYNEDAVAYLKSRSDNSLAGITAFQVVEHLTHSYLRELLKVAYMKLALDGFVFLETINTYCLDVFRTYYLDPTHQPPLPKDLLAVLMKFYGYQDLKAFYQSPIPKRGELNPVEWLLHYQNYALMGWKKENR